MIAWNFKRSVVVLLTVWFSVWSCPSLTSQPIGTPYPTCANANQKCARDTGCMEVPISFTYTEGYSPSNVLCINQGNADDYPVAANPRYRLQGCHTLFYNSYQNTSGVCSITTEDNGTELLLTGNEMVPGLHSFDCLAEESPIGMVSSNAIVVKDKDGYRDFLIYINGVLQYRYNSTNVTVDVGSNLTVVVRAVGLLNVSVITANDTRFTCKTGFACNQQYNLDNVHNRYLQCSLSTPAKLSDNGGTLLFSIDDIEMISFAITVNETSPATKEEGDPDIPIYAYVIAGVIIIIVGLLIGGITFYRKHSQKQTHEEEGNLIEKEIFTIYYHTLVNILPVGNILYQLVPVGIISQDDVAEINSNSMPRPTDKALFILNKIGSSLEAGYKSNFYTLLDIMEGYCNRDVREAVVDIRRALMTVLISTCPNCYQYDDGNKLHGYAIKKIPTGTDADENVFKAYLDKGIPLLTCTCSECEVVARLLRSSLMPESWKILQLHQTGSGGNSLQSNGRVKVIHTDQDDGVPVSEVLDWLKANVPRRGSTASSVCSQQGALGQNRE